MDITIANISIRQDADGRYNLNDLHRASGGFDKDRPSKWLSLEATRALVQELDAEVKKDQKRSIVSKQGLGTYACIELVYDYATWISPAFKVDVYRTFHFVKTENPVKQLPLDASFKLGKTAVQFYKTIGLDNNAAAIAANQVVIKSYGTNLLELGGQTHLISATQCHYYTPTDLSKELGDVSAAAVNTALRDAGLQTNISGKWTPTESGQPYGRIFDTGKAHNDGVPITQLKWSMDVLDFIRERFVLPENLFIG
ncbi:MAG: hypothetical protein RL661_885 [Pseudomonadota bacterium]|jgi:hypothetical protein